MEVRHALQNLPEATLNFTRRHASFLDRSIEITTRAKFHDLTPVLILILNKIDSLDNVDVM
jgi:hypothetical protein